MLNVNKSVDHGKSFVLTADDEENKKWLNGMEVGSIFRVVGAIKDGELTGQVTLSQMVTVPQCQSEITSAKFKKQ